MHWELPEVCGRTWVRAVLTTIIVSVSQAVRKGRPFHKNLSNVSKSTQVHWTSWTEEKHLSVWKHCTPTWTVWTLRESERESIIVVIVCLVINSVIYNCVLLSVKNKWFIHSDVHTDVLVTQWCFHSVRPTARCPYFSYTFQIPGMGHSYDCFLSQ